MKKRIKALIMAVAFLMSSFVGLLGTPIEARAEGGVVLRLHYHRADADYAKWSVWFWEEGKDGADYPFSDENGEKVATFEATPGTMNVGFIVRTEGWDKDIAEDQFIDISEMVSGSVDVYVESGVKGYEKTYGDDAVKGTKLKNAKYDGNTSVEITMTGEVTGDLNSAFMLMHSDMAYMPVSVAETGDCVYTFEVSEKLNPIGTYTIFYEGQGYKVIMPDYYSTEDFENQYTYLGDDLGATWTKASTTFRVWAPTAEMLEVRLYESGDGRVSDRIEEIPMEKSDKGTWVAKKDGDLNGTYYTYHVTVNGVGKETCDPYARTTGLNGERAMVIDLEATNPEGWENDKNPHAGERINDAIIYEGHIRDLTTEKGAGIEHVGKYLGVSELGTKTESGIATGLSHMIDLGITHLHILPFYDFGSVDEKKTVSGIYNWGYDPMNYNVPEGSYSTDAANGEVRVKEVKEMVKSLHDNGISVVMDVVYNHVYNAQGFCFNVLVPGYFSRITPGGAYSSGSGCGNDTASERAMVRKYIVDSVCYWADEYHIDGFRFDLVGLIDVDTVNEIVKEVHKDHPDVIFYGEGWSMTTFATKENVLMATQVNSELTPEFAYFNDTIRNGVRGSVFDTGKAFVSGSSGDAPKVERCFFGLDSWCKNPSQTVNYVSCHDNNTLFDRISLSRKDASYDDLVKMNNLSAAIVLTSEGIPFMQAGEEMLRSKVNDDGSFNENSYNAGDKVNSILYSSLENEKVKATYDYYKGLISFRKAHKALRLETAEGVNSVITSVKQDATNCLAFDIDGKTAGDISDEIFVIFNAEEKAQTIALPEGEWKICVNGELAGNEEIGTASGSVSVEPISAMVLCKGQIKTAEAQSAANEDIEDNLPSPKKVISIGAVSIGVLVLAAIGIVVALLFKKK